MTTIQDLSRSAADTADVVLDATRQVAATAADVLRTAADVGAEGLHTAAGAGAEGLRTVAGAGAEGLRTAAGAGEEMSEWLSVRAEDRRRARMLEGAVLALVLTALFVLIRRSRARRLDATSVPPPEDLASFQPATVSTR